MNTIFIVFQSIAYEGESVQGIYADAAEAEKHRAALEEAFGDACFADVEYVVREMPVSAAFEMTPHLQGCIDRTRSEAFLNARGPVSVLDSHDEMAEAYEFAQFIDLDVVRGQRFTAPKALN